jgi:ubiquinone/menaquinone biosynthesis C-methylase UbiE
MGKGVFDRLAGRYDAWFESERGSALFRAEVQCLERVMPPDRSDWVEVGVGSGRFAQALGISEGVDPSLALLDMARARGIKTLEGVAEELPYGDNSLEGVLLVVTLCFLDDPHRAIRECARVLRPGGRFVVGIVPADSALGQFYMRKSDRGHPFYSVARFYTADEVRVLAGSGGFVLEEAASTLGGGPDGTSEFCSAADGVSPGWSFVAMGFRLQDGDACREDRT